MAHPAPFNAEADPTHGESITMKEARNLLIRGVLKLN